MYKVLIEIRIFLKRIINFEKILRTEICANVTEFYENIADSVSKFCQLYIKIGIVLVLHQTTYESAHLVHQNWYCINFTLQNIYQVLRDKKF